VFPFSRSLIVATASDLTLRRQFISPLLKWVVGKVSRTTNVAAELLLRRIIIHFFQGPVLDDALSLELFDDWTLHLVFTRFLCGGVVNAYVPLWHFKSVYMSSLQLDASYNLRKFNVSINRLLIEIDYRSLPPAPVVDEELDASIQHLAEQLPAEQVSEGGWED
jgi:hypothetical protein